jgi:hypothetical protein
MTYKLGMSFLIDGHHFQRDGRNDSGGQRSLYPHPVPALFGMSDLQYSQRCASKGAKRSLMPWPGIPVTNNLDLSSAFTWAFKELEPIPQFKATAKLREFSRCCSGLP